MKDIMIKEIYDKDGRVAYILDDGNIQVFVSSWFLKEAFNHPEIIRLAEDNTDT